MMNAETASTPSQRETGLMYRKVLPSNSGMIFVWNTDTSDRFWMKNTFIPLSVAFVDSSGEIIDIQAMAPQTEDLHASPRPYRYAIEANQGYFVAKGIGPGDRMNVTDAARAGERAATAASAPARPDPSAGP